MRRITAVAYAVNGSGLGHLTRVLAILRWCRRFARLAGHQFDAYVLTSSEGCALAFEEGFAAFKIPSKTVIREAGMPKPEYLRLARQWVWHSLGLVDPDLLLVDTFPGGSFGELIHALDGPRARVFVHRAMREEFARSDTVQALLPFYDAILLPVEPGGEPQRVDVSLESRTHRVGPIMLRSREELLPRERARRRLGVPDGKLAVWVSAGGGGDPTAPSGIAALAGALATEPDLHVVVGAGPLFRGEPLRGPNVTWLQSYRAVDDLLGLDAAISAAGYNSFHELLHAGVPTALYAQEKIADEQARRVRAATAAGAAIELETDATGAPVAGAIERVLETFRDARRRAELGAAAEAFVPANFAREAAAVALSSLLPGSALDDARDLGSTALFLDLDRRRVDLDDALRVLRVFERVPDLDGVERGELLTRFLGSCGEQAPESVRLFSIFASRTSAVATHDDAERLVDAAARAARALLRFDDERAAAALLRLLPAERACGPEALASALDDLTAALSERADSLWRGMSVVGRCLGTVGAGAAAIAALRAATVEIRSSALGEHTL